MLRSFAAPAPLVLALLAGGCTFDGDSEQNADSDAAARDGDAVQAPAPAPPSLSLEVDIASRQLNVYRGGQRVATHPVAVGSEEWPTPTGEWEIEQVIWNPRWVPPEESWAEDEEVAEPGDPDNPLGRAQLVYRAPNSIHGTSDTASLGKAVSHGSIRVANEVAIELARMAMEAGGAARDEAWYQRARSTPTERMEVVLPNPIPIRVVAGPVGGGAADSAANRAAAGR
ncbi:MAG TPA: L,D-transpeptidase [Longimicrobiales bacterium]|nr:L,D-transpeptidase [Longimicrobiales bacterium]